MDEPLTKFEVGDVVEQGSAIGIVVGVHHPIGWNPITDKELWIKWISAPNNGNWYWGHGYGDMILRASMTKKLGHVEGVDAYPEPKQTQD